MWKWKQDTGELYDPIGRFVVQGYAGQGAGKNNHDMQSVKQSETDNNDAGPLPCGDYTIGKAYKHSKLGVLTMNLEPFPENNMFDRSAFRIHGDSISNPGNASDGCPILPRWARSMIATSSDKIFRVFVDL